LIFILFGCFTNHKNTIDITLTLKKNGEKMEQIQNNLQPVGGFEPLRSNRFIIKFSGLDIPPYLFKSYKFYNNGDEIIFLTEIYDVAHYFINPQDLFNVIDVIVEHLDPTGEVIQGLKFEVKGMNFVQTASYQDDSILTTKVRLVIKEATLNKLFKSNNENGNG
jgi:hypothetical protein